MTTEIDVPVLYSFRRCPYAMRARFALKYARIACIVREIDLKAKAKEFLCISPKGTVPVLVLSNGEVIDESMHIIEWALHKRGDCELSNQLNTQAQEIVATNDSMFVRIINHYKYPERYPGQNVYVTKVNLYHHLEKLNQMVHAQKFLLNETLTKADIAVFPFVRQVVQIAPAEFHIPSLKDLMLWLDYFLKHPLFEQIMAKHPVWQKDDTDILL